MSTDEISNVRHYSRMAEALVNIERPLNMASLGSLIATLDFLVESVEGVNPAWKMEFRKQWGILEEVNAVHLDDGRESFSLSEQQLLDRAVVGLKSLIDEAAARGRPTRS